MRQNEERRRKKYKKKKKNPLYRDVDVLVAANQLQIDRVWAPDETTTELRNGSSSRCSLP